MNLFEKFAILAFLIIISTNSLKAQPPLPNFSVSTVKSRISISWSAPTGFNGSPYMGWYSVYIISNDDNSILYHNETQSTNIIAYPSCAFSYHIQVFAFPFMEARSDIDVSNPQSCEAITRN